MRIFIISLFLLLTSCASKGISFDNIIDGQIISKSNGFVTLNPYQNAPLSAELTLSDPVRGLTVLVKGQDGEGSDISYTWDQENTVFPILGLYFDATNEIILTMNNVSKTLYLVVSDKQPDLISNITILQNSRPIDETRKNLLTFLNPVAMMTDLFAVDNYGKIRWYLKSKHEVHGMKFHENKDAITFSVLDTVTPEILTYDMVGKLVNKIKGPKTHSYNVPEADKRFHHELFYRDNGNIIVLDKSQYGVEDMILELAPNGKIVKEILIGDWIRKTVNGDPKDNTGFENFIFDSENNPYDEYKADIRYPGMPVNQNAIDWAHINAFGFDEENNKIYLSFRQHGIFAFDYDKESLEWIAIRSNYTIPTQNKSFYNLPDQIEYVYNIPSLQPYILKGEGADHPHSVSVLGDNQIMVFDNSGNDGEFPDEGSRMLVFSVDENKTLNIDWEFRYIDPQNGKPIYAQIVSDIDKTPFNTYIGTFGATTPFTIIEVTENKEVIFDMRVDIRAKNESQSDIALPIACPTTRLAVNGAFLYRSDYAPLYPNSLYKVID